MSKSPGLTGVLALQGAYAKHQEMLLRCAAPSIQVRTAKELHRCSRLILPGGESTAICYLLLRSGLWRPLLEYSRSGRPLLGTCAGMILLSSAVVGVGALVRPERDGPGHDGLEQPCLGAMDLRVQRNSYGPQIASFRGQLDWNRQRPEDRHFESFVSDFRASHSDPEGRSLPLIFIRAPLAVSWGSGVRVLLRYHGKSGPEGCEEEAQAVCLQQGRVLVCSFHPELSGNTLLHRYFLSL